MNITVLRVTGAQEQHTAHPAVAILRIRELIGANLLEVVNLRDGRVMFVDDAGYVSTTVRRQTPVGEHIACVPLAPRKPFNDEATKLYHAICKPGTTHRIAGDVAICRDEDFGGL